MEKEAPPALTTFDKTATLPASFRKRATGHGQQETASPRNPGLNRNASFSKRFRKSCRKWAVEKGIVEPKKKEEVAVEKTEEVLSAEVVEEKKPSIVRRNSCPDAAEVAEVVKEDDLAAVVASLVVEAQKKESC